MNQNSYTKCSLIDCEVDEIKYKERYFSASGTIEVQEDYEGADEWTPPYWVATENPSSHESLEIHEIIGDDLVKISRENPIFATIAEIAVERAIDYHYS